MHSYDTIKYKQVSQALKKGIYLLSQVPFYKKGVKNSGYKYDIFIY